MVPHSLSELFPQGIYNPFIDLKSMQPVSHLAPNIQAFWQVSDNWGGADEDRPKTPYPEFQQACRNKVAIIQSREGERVEESRSGVEW